MLRTIAQLKSFAFIARDGEAGKFRDVYFDDQSWGIRSILVKTGAWFSNRLIFVSPEVIGFVDDDRETLTVHLTKEELRIGSLALSHTNPSRPFSSVTSGSRNSTESSGRTMERVSSYPDELPLWTASQMIGQVVHATDADLGHVDDLHIPHGFREICYVSVSRSWWPGKKMLLPVQWLEGIDRSDGRLSIPLAREIVKRAPVWDDSEPVTRELQDRLVRYYEGIAIGSG